MAATGPWEYDVSLTQPTEFHSINNYMLANTVIVGVYSGSKSYCCPQWFPQAWQGLGQTVVGVRAGGIIRASCRCLCGSNN